MKISVIFALLMLIPMSLAFADNTAERICHDGKINLHRYDKTLVCVTPSTAEKLIERGWGLEVISSDKQLKTGYSDAVLNERVFGQYWITEDKQIMIGNNTSLFPSFIDLDQKKYTAPDTVLVTILYPNHNKNPQLVEEINHTMNITDIKTRSSQVNEFRFVETGVDTGIFKGQFEMETYHDYYEDKTLHSDKNLIVEPDDGVTIRLYNSETDMWFVGSAKVSYLDPNY